MVQDSSCSAFGSASWGATLVGASCEPPSEASDSAVRHQQGSLGVWEERQRQYAVGSSAVNQGVHEDAEEEQMIPFQERHHRHHHRHHHRQHQSWPESLLDLYVHEHSHTIR